MKKSLLLLLTSLLSLVALGHGYSVGREIRDRFSGAVEAFSKRNILSTSPRHDRSKSKRHSIAEQKKQNKRNTRKQGRDHAADLHRGERANRWRASVKTNETDPIESQKHPKIPRLDMKPADNSPNQNRVHQTINTTKKIQSTQSIRFLVPFSQDLGKFPFNDMKFKPLQMTAEISIPPMGSPRIRTQPTTILESLLTHISHQLCFLSTTNPCPLLGQFTNFLLRFGNEIMFMFFGLLESLVQRNASVISQT